VQIRRFARALVRHFVDDDVQNVGAMLAYYAVLALFPMLVFVLSIALVVLPHDTVREGLAMATATVPATARTVLERRLDTLLRTAGTGFAILGAALALWGASRGAVALSQALNSVFHKRDTRSWLRRQLTAIAVTTTVAVLAVIALSLLVLGPLVGHAIAARLGFAPADFDVPWSIVRWLGAGVLVTVLWAIVYRFLPDTDAPFRIFTPGAVVGVLLWLGISALFGLYIGHFNSYEATYGTLGGAIIFLTWIWLSNIALLVGAQINEVLAALPKSTHTRRETVVVERTVVAHENVA
jgi:membrane protein